MLSSAFFLRKKKKCDKNYLYIPIKRICHNIYILALFIIIIYVGGGADGFVFPIFRYISSIFLYEIPYIY